MNTNPTNEHREQAREIVYADINIARGQAAERLIDRIASALSSRDAEIERLRGWQQGLAETTVAWSEQRLADIAARDAEIREVLEGLITSVEFDEGGNPTQHWCPISDDGDNEHGPACTAAMTLWSKLQPKESSDVT